MVERVRVVGDQVMDVAERTDWKLVTNAFPLAAPRALLAHVGVSEDGQ